MSSNLVIVAIPARDEKVWKVSSEQVPHLTLLFLGENTEDVDKLERIVEFVDHAVTMSEHGPFMMDVDERGTLGPDTADVLFFRKDYSSRWITGFRNQLLQQNDIRTAYDSALQFPEWQPHLTLGYPATPANEDEIPEHGLNWITFDRIAVWTQDFDGPEFKLHWPDRELESCMAMAGTNNVRKAIGLDTLVKELEIPVEHHGIKGMRWGVRKENVTGGVKKIGRAIGKVASDVQFENMARDGRAADHIENKGHADFRKIDLPKINTKPEYQAARKLRTRLRNPRDPVVKQYRKEIKTTYIQRMEKTANSLTNKSGTRQYTIRERGWDLPSEGGNLPTSKHIWEVSTRTVQHDDSTTKPFFVELILDQDGFVTDINQINPSDFTQHTAELGAEFIAHYGIKGMHWGIHTRQSTRSTPSPVAPKATSHVPSGAKRKTKLQVEGGQNHPAHEDAIKVALAKVKLKKSGVAALSNQELRDVANRVQLENQVSLLTSHKGKRFVTQQLQNEGQNLARTGVKVGVKRGIKKAGIAALA
jgi:2'-5' RNA ligase